MHCIHGWILHRANERTLGGKLAKGAELGIMQGVNGRQ